MSERDDDQADEDPGVEEPEGSAPIDPAPADISLSLPEDVPDDWLDPKPFDPAGR